MNKDVEIIDWHAWARRLVSEDKVAIVSAALCEAYAIGGDHESITRMKENGETRSLVVALNEVAHRLKGLANLDAIDAYDIAMNAIRESRIEL